VPFAAMARSSIQDDRSSSIPRLRLPA